MIKYTLFLLILFSFTLAFAEEPFEGILVKIKDEQKYPSDDFYKDFALIKEYVKKSKPLSENELANLNKILSFFYKYEKTSGNNILRVALLLNKDQIHIIRPLLLEILSNPEGDNGRFVLYELDYLFDDYSGEMLLKYKYIIKNDYDLIGYLITEKFNPKKYKTFKELFILLLNSQDRKVKEKMYVWLKEKISFIDCLSEKRFEKSNETEKDIEIHKMAQWLKNSPDVEVAIDRFFSDLIINIQSLKIENYDQEIDLLKIKYQFLERLPGSSRLCFDPFDEKDRGFSLGLKFVVVEIQNWLKLNMNVVFKYSTHQLDLLIRDIENKVTKQNEIYGHDGINNTVDKFRKKMAEIKLAKSSKDQNLRLLGLYLSSDLRGSISRTRSEPHKEFYKNMLKELYELLPEVLESEKRQERTLYENSDFLTLHFEGSKIKIDEKGVNLKVVFQNVDACDRDVTIGEEFSFAQNMVLIFKETGTGKIFQIGKIITEIEPDTENLTKAKTLKVNEKVDIIISDLVEQTKNFELPKGEYRV